MSTNITIDFDKKCQRCGKKGATPSGMCMACVVKGVARGEFDHLLKAKRSAQPGEAEEDAKQAETQKE